MNFPLRRNQMKLYQEANCDNLYGHLLTSCDMSYIYTY